MGGKCKESEAGRARFLHRGADTSGSGYSCFMKKIKYYYNTHTLRYEKLETPLRVKLLRIFGFIAAALVTSAIISLLAFRFIGSPNEKLLRAENERMKDRYRELTKETKKIEQQ